MLRINVIANSAQARSYYRSGNDPNYFAGEEREAYWHGRGAAALGLSGEVSAKQFELLIDNRHPFTGEQVTAKKIAHRRCGYDFTWSVSKSVTLAATLGGDGRIAGAFREAVAETMADIEKEVEVRVRKLGKRENRHAGNIVWCDWLHTDSRPVDGKIDPQLHIHATVMNTVFDPVERQWKAGEFAAVKSSAPYFEAAFRARMANKLQDLGYEVKRVGKDFELVGVSPSSIREFSRRTDLIDETAKERGITNVEGKAALGAKTRGRKQKPKSWDAQVEEWRSRLGADDLAAIDRTVASAREGGPIAREQGEEAAVDFALAHLLERKSAVPERHVATEALRFGIGSVTPEGVVAEIAGRDLVRDGAGTVSTQEVLGEEERIVRWAKEGRGACKPVRAGFEPAVGVATVTTRPPTVSRSGLSSPSHAFSHSATAPLGDIATLSPSQSSAVKHVLSSRDRLILVRGAAGVGKTTMLHALTSQLSGPWGVFATQTSASRGVLRDDGFKDANTLAFLLKDKPTQDRLRGGLIVIDEASQTGAKELSRVVELADQLNARILLLGDRRQHKSVARGDILALLESEAKLPVVEVSDIKRQAGEYRDAVKLLADGRTGAAFHKLHRLGWVKEAKSSAGGKQEPDGAASSQTGRSESYGQLLDDYMAAVRKGESVLVVSPTNANAEVLTDQIRERLRQEGKLTGEDRTFQRLVPLNLTEAERATRSSIPRDAVIQFGKAGGGFRAGQRVGVSELADKGGDASAWTACLRGEVRLSTGDRIRTTATVKALDGSRLDNGTQLTVSGFTKSGDIQVKTATGLNRILPADVGHLAHAYVSTSHAAQGMTVQRVFVHMPAATLPAVTSETAYVSVSRGKLSATIYCDNKDGLLRQWAKEDQRMTAHDLIRARKKRFGERMRSFVTGIVQASARRIHHCQERESHDSVAYAR